MLRGQAKEYEPSKETKEDLPVKQAKRRDQLCQMLLTGQVRPGLSIDHWI